MSRARGIPCPTEQALALSLIRPARNVERHAEECEPCARVRAELMVLCDVLGSSPEFWPTPRRASTPRGRLRPHPRALAASVLAALFIVLWLTRLQPVPVNEPGPRGSSLSPLVARVQPGSNPGEILLSWEPLTGTAHYRVTLWSLGGDELFDDRDAAVGGLALSVTVPSGLEVLWLVRALDSDLHEIGSSGLHRARAP